MPSLYGCKEGDGYNLFCPVHSLSLRQYLVRLNRRHRSTKDDWERGIADNPIDAAAGADRFAAAHQALKADPSIQFILPPAPPPPETPAWLKAFAKWLGDVMRPVGRFLEWIGSFMPDAPYARILLWTILAIAAAGLLWMLYDRLRYGSWRLPRLRRRSFAEPVDIEEDWAPDAAPARSWLAEADALAAQGRYAEAIHHLLLRTVEDIARRRPALVRPSVTSRELSGATALPSAVRGLFARIAALVEHSLFAGRAVGEDDWSSARTAYADLVLPKAWRA